MKVIFSKGYKKALVPKITETRGRKISTGKFLKLEST